MKKTIFTLFLLIVVVFSCCGCSKNEVDNRINETNSFRLIRKVDESGKIVVLYSFPVNTKLLEEKGFNELQIKNYRFYLATLVNELIKQNKSKNVEGVEVSVCTYFKDIDGLGFSILFDDIDCQKQFYSSGEEDSGSSVKTSGLFMKKVKLKTLFPFSKTSASQIKQICQIALSSWIRDNSLENSEEILKTLDDSVYIYDYITCENKLKSQNFYSDGDYFHNVFIKSESEINENENISFYYVVPNAPIWYISALVAVIFSMILYYFVKTKRKKSEK